MKFDVLMEVTMKIVVFWDATPCGLLVRYEPFGRTCFCCLRGSLSGKDGVDIERRRAYENCEETSHF
jgi:hypothetical protein